MTKRRKKEVAEILSNSKINISLGIENIGNRTFEKDDFLEFLKILNSSINLENDLKKLLLKKLK